MKANEAPEKLYIDSREHWMKSWTAFTTKAKSDDIEYTRTDAFIKKACEWIETNMDDYIHVEYDMAGKPTNEAHIAHKRVVEDFKKAMKL